MTKTLTPKELAVELNSDPRTVRKFLRECARAAEVETPGKGSRWAIESKHVRTLRTGFQRWSERGAKAAEVNQTDPTAH